MKKIIVIMLVAVSALLARIECTHADRFYLEWILDDTEPGDATFVCREPGTRYEVAVNPALRYIVIGASYKSGGYDILWVDGDIVRTQYYDDLGVLVRVKMDVSSPERLMENYRELREMFDFQTNHRR